MPTSVTVSSNYQGGVAGQIIGKSFKEADTIRLGFITIAQGVNYKLNMRRIRYTNGKTDYACGHTPAGAIVLDERVLQTKKLKNDFDVCKEDFRATWSDPRMGSSAWNQMPADIRAAILTEVLADTAQDTDSMIWNGTGAAGQWQGFISLFVADAAVIKANNGITPIGAAITETNVESELKKVLGAIPVPLRRKTLGVGVSPDVFQAYWFYLVSKGIANDGNAQPKQVRFGKYVITELNGLPDNTIVVAERKNLVFGTGLQGDHNRVALVDEDSIGLLTGQVRGKLVYNGGCQYYNSEDVVYYLSTTTPT